MRKILLCMFLLLIKSLEAVTFENFDQLLDILLRKPMITIPAPSNLEIDGVSYNLSNFTQRQKAFDKMRGFFSETQTQIADLQEQVEAGADAGDFEALEEQLEDLTRQNDEEKAALREELDDLRAEYEEFKRQVNEMIRQATARVRPQLADLQEGLPQ